MLVSAAWLLWSQERSERHLRQEPLVCKLPPPSSNAPRPGMVWVPGGDLALGDTVYAEESPVRQVPVAGFWLDRTEVTNDEFAAFVKASAYVTVAERAVDPAKHPDLPPALRLPGAVVFVSPTDLSGQGSPTQWWRYVAGADWRHPGGPGTSIEGRGAFPVVNVTVEDAWAYARWKGVTLPTEAQWSGRRVALKIRHCPTTSSPPRPTPGKACFL